MNKIETQILESLQFLLSTQNPESERYKDKLAGIMSKNYLLLNPIETKEPYTNRAVEAINLIEGCGKIINQWSNNSYTCSKNKLCPECQAKLDDAKNVKEKIE